MAGVAVVVVVDSAAAAGDGGEGGGGGKEVRLGFDCARSTEARPVDLFSQTKWEGGAEEVAVTVTYALA